MEVSLPEVVALRESGWAVTPKKTRPLRAVTVKSSVKAPDGRKVSDVLTSRVEPLLSSTVPLPKVRRPSALPSFQSDASRERSVELMQGQHPAQTL